jgi:hypothetical protein
MHIKIAERLLPFMHSPGTLTPLPGTALCLEIFPTRICVYDLSHAKKVLVDQIQLTIKGPLQKFTVQLDLEKGDVLVWGQAPEGFIRYRMQAMKKGEAFAFIIEKSPYEIKCVTSGLFKIFSIDSLLVISKDPPSSLDLYKPPMTDRLSLGNHKAQDWSMVMKRGDLKEVLPIWLRLGQSVPQTKSLSYEGTATFLTSCENSLECGNATTYLQSFKALFEVGFEGIMVPRLEDELYQGYSIPALSEQYQGTPLILLSEGARLIRSMFIKEIQGGIVILPALPSQFHCGRLINTLIKGIGRLDLEWSKKTIRRLILRAESTNSIQLNFSNSINKCRLRQLESDSGNFIPTPASLQIEKGKTYLFDKFQK